MDTRGMERRRIRGVQMILGGKRGNAVARALKVSASSVSEWINAYRRGGWKALSAAQSHGAIRQFSTRHRKVLVSIVKKSPLDFGFQSDLWTVAMIGSVLNRKMKTRFSVSTILRYLHTERISFQRPKKVAFEGDAAAQTKWLERQLPAILSHAKRKGARVFFEDESGFELEATRGGTWSAKGNTPVIKRSGKRGRRTVAGAVSHLGDLHLKTYKKGGMTGERYASFLQSLKKSTAGRLWLSMMASQPTGRKL